MWTVTHFSLSEVITRRVHKSMPWGFHEQLCPNQNRVRRPGYISSDVCPGVFLLTTTTYAPTSESASMQTSESTSATTQHQHSHQRHNSTRITTWSETWGDAALPTCRLGARLNHPHRCDTYRPRWEQGTSVKKGREAQVMVSADTDSKGLHCGAQIFCLMKAVSTGYVFSS